MVDTLVSGASASRRVGSTPIMRTSRERLKNLSRHLYTGPAPGHDVFALCHAALSPLVTPVSESPRPYSKPALLPYSSLLSPRIYYGVSSA